MKQIIFASIILTASIFALPFVFMHESPLLGGQAFEPDIPPVESQLEATETSIIATPEPVKPHDGEIKISVQIDGRESKMSLRDYLRGVLLGEMPSSFPIEAVKAQAVAVRTLVLRDPEAVYCDDPSHCMAYTAPGANYPEVFDEAIAQTDGETLTYNGEPILAVFFSTSAGATESSEDVWGGEMPYLRAVDSPGEQDAPRYRGTVTVLASDFWATLSAEYPDAVESGEPFGAVKRSASGGVTMIEIGGVPVSGADIRRMFGLNSTNFITVMMNGSVVFETLGFGHGVGLSQYGARAMALNGALYSEILAHYYPDTVLTEYKEKQ